ncbi:polyisoprenoid-binding protein [Nocardioides immobilis]|uniref:Polyisoprenoid-binding protein n=1 Tax=Nocardioides immobilis TaxID=2049295 RepID=A0A417Y501_9ACTN|nr:YceI family protein [Nocardioides immobilis]RHW27584.1 polyisoprenoid-binding protein [Nocardioides immobilis]
MTNPVETFDASTAVLEDISGDYSIDPAHTRLGFVARHAMVTKVRGAFTEVSGTAHVDTVDPSRSSVSIAIVANSITTGQQQRDDHLRSGDFLDSEQYPEITFVSTSVDRDGDEWTIAGDLTIMGLTQPVTVPFEFTGSAKDPFGNVRIGFEGAAAIYRKDWGLTWNAALESGGVLVSDKVMLEFDVSAIKGGA